jgi:hypothetical protein
MNNVNDLIKNSSNRLRYIEFCLIYKGEVSRSDIVSKFDIKQASATRDLMQYSEDSHGRNLYFDSKTKKHLIRDDTFIPMYDISDSEALYWLKVECSPSENEVLAYRFKRMNLPSQKELSPIVRGIIGKRCVSIGYFSLNSGKKTERVIVPHSIFDDGLRLYIRAYDRKREAFLDLSASRIFEASLLDAKPDINELKKNDNEWNKEVELVIIPHPALRHKEIIEYEYKMIRGELRVKIKASTAGYFLRTWNIDCSFDAELPENVYHLHLSNIKSLSNISSINKLAPK